MTKRNLKIVFFGTPEFAVESLRRLVDDGFDVEAVVTMPDKKAGRGHKILQSDVKKFAVEKGLPVLQPANLKDQEFIDELRGIGADLFIVIAFRMLPEAVWSMPPLGTFNLHASLLPRYRGAAPINRAIMNGDTESGVTTFFLKHEIDTGDIINSRKVEIGPNDTAGDLHDRLMAIGAEEVIRTVNALSYGDIQAKPQPEGEFVPAPKIFKEDCHVDFERPAMKVHNQIRGLSPYPAAWCDYRDSEGKDHNIKIIRSAPADIETDQLPGTAIVKGTRLYVATNPGAIEITEIQPAGKRRMSAEAFLAGNKPEKFF